MELEEEKNNPMRRDMKAFLKKRNVRIDKAQGILFLISVMVNFLIYDSIKKFLKLPGISREADQADNARMSMLGRVLEYEAGQMDLDFHEIVEELIYPLSARREIVHPIMHEIFDMLDPLALSDDFRATTESQIENEEFWGDSLEEYSQRPEDYFQAVKELFILTVIVIRAGLGNDQKDRNFDKEFEDIRETYSIAPADYLKLRRRATDFFKIAFASYLQMKYQPLKDQVDRYLNPPASDD